ncbi:hypothetical protein TMEN_9252 [Trichophyton mentagrophytes]|uniref:Vacuolar ATPase assembly protein VMA22 n=1 Tax=Trichophyton interdigitale (strain MR816) TaxID=1215338 RepID=A0A059J5Q2_TRIIM|nr:hypothetical protein H101_01077 [Trichophyton interdigitale H6]KDB23028.1 hypothetical protein H109_05059 [Trichophyton interdigitale MR816]GBF66532.1 hypothetical protein TMEN_9252 [Trichophyton mentagrophytes]
MEETLPTPPATPADGREARSEAEVVQAIDELLERYLHLLDEQQKLQEDIGKQFASGFFSLARANHACPPGRRYGEDYYDERMKAIRQVYVETEDKPELLMKTSRLTDDTREITTTASEGGLHASLDESAAPAFKIVTIETKPDSSRDKDAKEGTDKPSEDKDEDHAQTSTETETKEASTKTKSKSKTTSNPLHWFGILVPPPLRNAQEAFVGAVAGPIPTLAGVVSEMREVEHKVEGLRQLLRIK